MIQCPQCSQVLPDGTALCSACGARVVAPARAGGMRLCHGCGAIAPAERQSCSLCQQPFTRLEAPARTDGAYWAQIRTELTCRQCGGKSPIDAPDLDGTVTCATCSTIQAFDVGVWSDALAHAHAVADLAGPNVEGRGGSTSIAAHNPYLAIGITNTTATLDLTGMTISGGVMRTRNLSVSASPGHPLCGTCHTPVEAMMQTGGNVATRCPTCGDQAQYAMPPGLPSMHAPLVLAIADDLRTDRPEARVNATSAGMVVALNCPSCGGAIDVQVGERAATCKFCRASCRIPQRTLLSLKKQNERPRPWWALFRGPSPKRQQLEALGREDLNPFAGHAFDHAAEVARGLEDPPQRRSQTFMLLARAIQIGVPLAVFFVVGVVCFLPVVWGWLHGYGSTTEPPPFPWP